MVNENRVLSPEMAKISHELMFRKYLFGKETMKKYLRVMDLSEYITMNVLVKDGFSEEKRVYLRDVAETLKMDMHKISKIIGKLKERELVIWSHDGNGKGGTYVIVTDMGWKLLQEQEAVLGDYYKRIITELGQEDAIALVSLLKRLEEAMKNAEEETMYIK